LPQAKELPDRPHCPVARRLAQGEQKAKTFFGFLRPSAALQRRFAPAFPVSRRRHTLCYDSRPMKTVLLLICSNIFMTAAWYGHLKYRKAPLIAAIVVSWLIAFFEYCFQVPANRIGYGEFTAFQLKIIQEAITLCVFAVFAFFYLGESLKWNYALSFLCIMGAVTFAFWGKL
jgi:uncharacterized protein